MGIFPIPGRRTHVRDDDAEDRTRLNTVRFKSRSHRRRKRWFLILTEFVWTPGRVRGPAISKQFIKNRLKIVSTRIGRWRKRPYNRHSIRRGNNMFLLFFFFHKRPTCLPPT